MIKPIGQELFRLYCILWEHFRKREFPMEKAISIIQPLYKKNPDIPYVLIGRLAKNGWISRRKEKKNSILKLTPINKIIKEIGCLE